MDSQRVFNISQLYGRKIKPTNERFGLWLLLENVENLITNIGDIDYAEGEKLLKSELFAPITDPFCDNVIIVKICSLEDCDGNGKTPIIKKDICGSFNSYLRGKFGKFISARHGVKAKLPFLLKSNNQMAKGLERVIGEDYLENIYKKYYTPVCIPYKVELSDVKLESLLEELKELLSQLRKEDYFLMDLDITQDFTGIFKKAEMGNYLTSNFNFCYQGEYKRSCNVILDNDNTVGKDCLTWITSNARVKIYNKFICQVTSPGVNKKIGNHIIDFINCPDTRLRETFRSASAKEHGITRLEATIYNYSIGNYCNIDDRYKPLEDCLSLLESSKLYFAQAPMYSVSFANMWKKLSDTLQNSCCLVFNNILQYVYWANKNTGKLTGIQLKLPENTKNRDKLISYVISAFSFNCLPINYINIVEDSKCKDNIQMEQKCYIKSGETFFSRSSTAFSIIPENLNIEHAGLISTNNIVPQILRKRTNITNRLLPFALKEITPVSKLCVLSAKKRKIEMEEVDLKRRKLEYLERTRTLKEEYHSIAAKENELVNFKEKLTAPFRIHWKNLDTNCRYNVVAFTVNDKRRFPHVGVLVKEDAGAAVYIIRGYHKNIFIKAFGNKEALIKDGYLVICNNGPDIISLPNTKPFLTFITNGVTTYKGHSFAKIEKMEFLTDAWTNMQDITITQAEIDWFDDISMQEVKGLVTIKNCKRLEELAEGTQLVIKAIKRITHRSKLRYIMQFEDIDPLYLSNFWFEKEIAESVKDLNYKIKIRLDKIKYTPSRNKERIVFCV